MRWASVMSRGAVYASATLLTVLGCKKQEPEGPPTREALVLAERMIGKVYKKPGYAYPLPYRLFVPDGYDATRRYPLILYLHGGGVRGSDNIRHLTEVVRLGSLAVQTIEAAFVLAPQCPTGDQWVNGARSVPFTNYVQAKVPESAAAKQTLEILSETIAEYSIDKARVYVTGPSMGASGTWDFITRYPGRFAAAVPINGINDPSRAAVIAQLPIWAFHGALDDVSPVSNTRAMVAELRKRGSPVTFSELPNQGHGCDGAAYDNPEVFRWLFAQRLPPKTESERPR
jgi:predicted peptidase